MQLIRLLKDWTLPVAIATGCVVYMIFALVPQLDTFATCAAPVFDALLPMFMFLVLFVTFCKVDFRRLRPGISRPPSRSGKQTGGQKNTAFAIWIACTYLSPLSAVGPGCYILWQNIINSIEIWRAQISEK